MQEKRYHSLPLVSHRAKDMRHDPAPAEKLLWSKLRAGQLRGLKFRRQHPIDQFILDFFCASVRVAVEVDGDSHTERWEYDEKRTTLLESNAITVIRFSNTDVFGHLDNVLEEILRVCERQLNTITSPSP